MPTKPKIWTMTDIPTPEEMAEYLGRVRATRDAFLGVAGFPLLPPDMDGLTFEGANNIERFLLKANETMDMMEKSRVYSGELQAGGF